MKTSTALIIGAGALAIVFLWSRSSSASSLLGGAKPATGTSTQNLLTLGGGILGGLGAGFLFSPGAGSSTTVNTSSSLAQQNAIDYGQASNYIADTTAASDTETGVVGFGGW